MCVCFFFNDSENFYHLATKLSILIKLWREKFRDFWKKKSQTFINLVAKLFKLIFLKIWNEWFLNIFYSSVLILKNCQHFYLFALNTFPYYLKNYHKGLLTYSSIFDNKIRVHYTNNGIFDIPKKALIRVKNWGKYTMIFFTFTFKISLNSWNNR